MGITEETLLYSPLNSSSSNRGSFMKSFRFDTICNITQEPQELQRYNCAYHGFLSKSGVRVHDKKYQQQFMLLTGSRISNSLATACLLL